MCTIKEEVLIHLVSEDEEIVLDGELCEELKFRKGKHFAAGVGGCVQNETTCAWGHSGMQALRVKAPLWSIQGNHDGSDPHRLQSCHMVAVEGLKDETLVSWIQQSHEGGIHCTGSAGGHEDLGARVDKQAVKGGTLVGNRLS